MSEVAAQTRSSVPADMIATVQIMSFEHGDSRCLDSLKVGDTIELQLNVSLPVLGDLNEVAHLSVEVGYIFPHKEEETLIGVTFKGKADGGEYVLGHIFCDHPSEASWIRSWTKDW